MTSGEAATPSSSLSLGNQLARCQAPGCSRVATKASSGRWCWWDDPAVPEAEKLAARQLGGRRGLMGSTQAALLLEGSTLETSVGRNDLRAKLAAARATGQIGTAMLRDLLAVVDGAARDVERNGSKKEPPKPILVEVARFGPPPGDAA